VSPYARRRGEGRSGDRDVIERARIAIAASVSATSKASHRAEVANTDDVVDLRLPQHRMPPLPPPSQPRENFVVHGMRHVVAGTAAAAAAGSSRRPPASVSSRTSGVTNSSVEPDSDAAVVGSVLPELHQHNRENYGGFENADRPLLSPSDVDVTTPRTRPVRNHSRPGVAPDSFGAPTPKFLSSPLPNPPSREDEDYDTWLDSALATQTFDDPTGGEGDGAERNVGTGAKSAHDPRKHSLLKDDDDDDDDDDDSEPLRDWLDSVLP
jgi:hypothetical protein